MALKGPAFAMEEGLSADLDRVLDGHEVASAAIRRRKPRGAIDDAKLLSVVKEAKKQGLLEVADAVRVCSGCTLRQQDLEALTAAE
jgi:hypothetical protein